MLYCIRMYVYVHVCMNACMYVVALAINLFKGPMIIILKPY